MKTGRDLLSVSMTRFAIIDADEVSRTAARVLAEQLRCDRALYAEMEPDQDHCTVIGEYTSVLPGSPGLTGFPILAPLTRLGSR